MYHGDGSYKAVENLEVSLIDLLEEEKDLVSVINSSIKAKDVLGGRSSAAIRHERELEDKKEKLFKVRLEIRAYLENLLEINWKERMSWQR